MSNVLPENRDLIEAYLLGELSAEEIEAVETRKQNDPAFEKEILHYQTVMEAVNETKVLEFRKIWTEIDEDAAKESSPGTRILPFRPGVWTYAIAAAVVLVFAVVLLNRNRSNYADEYYSTYPLSQIVRDTSTPDFSDWEKAYQAGNYEEAVAALIREFSESPRLRDSLLFFVAASNLELGKNETAIALFSEILDHQQFSYQEEARWYLAMAWLKDDQPDQAVPYLKEISGTTGPHFNKAKATELLGKLLE